MEASKKITVQSMVQSPVEKVWNYWTTPDHITKWNQASEDWHSPFAENDLRKGGKFKTTMAAKDGSMSFDFEGIYDQIIEHQLIEYTMPDGRKVQVAFQEMDNNTIVRETFDPDATNPEEMQRGGWQAILDSFKSYCERN